ncbi:hypothetical protein ACCO45_013564 [Purpureocillium lilacinum]|uniref:Uncharacterized protein n=1 Tax=Purpureocillium lilacinum TaxID=33203 RepID=A0ACC4D6F3_PURLI
MSRHLASSSSSSSSLPSAIRYRRDLSSCSSPGYPHAQVVGDAHGRHDAALEQHHAVPTPRPGDPDAVLAVDPVRMAVRRRLAAHDALRRRPARGRPQRPREARSLEYRLILRGPQRQRADENAARHGVQGLASRAVAKDAPERDDL